MPSPVENFLLRSGIFAVLASLVTTVIYLTPVPGELGSEMFFFIQRKEKLEERNFWPQLTEKDKIEFASCERPCHALMWPMICRVKLNIELYQSMSRACGDCPNNASDCFRQGCVPADGHPRGILTVDRQMPGPVINVCKDDILLVDVVNRASGHELAMHWRGQPQREAPMMDGVPMVTQCPIASNTVFQYKFRASRPGIHLYQAFTGSPAVESVFGALVVRQPDTADPHLGLYDEDKHVVVVSEWRHGSGPHALLQPDPAAPPSQGAVLFNGRTFTKGGVSAPETLVLQRGRRHRVRLALAGGGEGCSVRLWAEGHQLALIELDGAAIAPTHVASITLAPGERADVVLTADQPPAAYWLRASTAVGCAGPPLHGAAVLLYEGSESSLPATPPDAPSPAAGPAPAAAPTPSRAAPLALTPSTPAPTLSTLTKKPSVAVVSAINDNELHASDEERSLASASPPHYDSRCGAEGASLCPVGVRASDAAPPEVAAPQPYVRLALPFGYRMVPADNATAAGIVVPQKATHVRVPHVNNITFRFPSSPVLTQPEDVDPEVLCHEGSLPFACAEAPRGGFCQCTHVLHIPFGASVELLLINQGGEGGDEDAVLHMHGYALHVVGMGRFQRALSAQEALELDSKGALLQRELANPLHKDTVAVPKHAVVAARFKAENAGYWLLHEERASRWAAGLAVLLHVGTDGDTPAPPDGFPRCGSFVGPHFFLI